MANLRESELQDFIRRRSSTANGLLIYGGNANGIAEAAQTIARILGNGGSVQRMEASVLRDSQGALDGAFRSMSLLAGRELIVVEGCEEIHAKYILPVVASKTSGNFVLLLAGALNKTSSLRKACEDAPSFYCMPVYDDKPADIMARVRDMLDRRGLRFSGDAEEVFATLCGTERALAQNEAEKLALYCTGSTVITEQDVAACCGDQASYGADSLIDAVLDGDAAAADRMLATLGEGGWRTVLPVFSAHLARLTALRLEADRTGEMETTLRNARPVIYFGRKAAVLRQLHRLTVEDLVRIQGSLESCVLRTRQLSDLGEQITSRMMLSLAVEARKSG